MVFRFPSVRSLGRRGFAVGFPLALALCLPGQTALAQRTAKPATDRELSRAFGKLDEDEQHDLCEWFLAEMRSRRSPERARFTKLLEGQKIDPGFWPAPAPPPVYDPEVHAPGLPIERKLLSERKSSVKRLRKEFLREAPEGSLITAWGYDWKERSPVREPLEREERSQQIFSNALAGHDPEAGLVRVLVLQALDDGRQQEALGAFAHAYTDREGGVYPGVTLFDAWDSGRRIEMPDVDALGLWHDIEDDWTSYVSPVPSNKHDELYSRLQAHFETARSYRNLRLALAATFTTAEPRELEALAPHAPRFHALWREVRSDPELMARKLARVTSVRDFLTELTRRTGDAGAFTQAGRAREEGLQREAKEVRATWVRIMRESGALKTR